jgi:hypothetical protein
MKKLLMTAILVAALSGAAPARADDEIPVDPVQCGPGEVASLSAVECGGVEDVPSLDPADGGPSIAAAAADEAARPYLVPAGCHIQNDAVFYAAGDWIRLGQKLVAEASPCSRFLISIPPLAADKTKPRVVQDDELRKVGPQAIPLFEVHFAGWQAWRQANGKTWFEAGVEARRTLEDAGYEGWALNEVPSSVRQGLPSTRANLALFLDGIYQGDGSVPPLQGVVYVVGVGQNTSPLGVYKTNLRNWLADSLFWGAARRTVQFWAQEVYADTRYWGVELVSRDVRSAYVTDYVQHPIILARAGGDADRAALDFLERTYTPLANAAWRWDFGFGNTMVPVDQMKMFVAEQTYAMRDFVRSYAYGTRNGRMGFAWAQRNVGPDALPPAEFVASTAAILERMADSLRHAYGQRGGSPADACGPPGKRVWCDGAVPGAGFYDGWKEFAIWP